MATVLLGNESVIETKKIDEEGEPIPGNTIVVARPELGRQITTCSIPDGYEVELPDGTVAREWPLKQRLDAIDTFVRYHFAAKPTWVESDDAVLAQYVADSYGCRIGRPRGWSS